MTPENERDLAELAGVGSLFLEACEQVGSGGHFRLSRWSDKWMATIQFKAGEEQIQTRQDGQTPQRALDAAVLRLRALKKGF